MTTARRDSINALLDRAGEQLLSIEAEYHASLEKKAIDPALKVDIKNFFENLRSVLDYLAHEIRDSSAVQEGGEDWFYFPIAQSDSQLAGMLQKWFPGLKERRPALYSFIESVQPYAEAAGWLAKFNRVNNDNKHGDLVEQTRVESEEVEVTSAGGGKVTWKPAGVRFGSGVRIHGVPIDPNTQLPVPNQKVQTTRTVWVDFRFAGVDVSALALMRQAMKGVHFISEGVLQRLDEADSA